jgi:hypothetical protein
VDGNSALQGRETVTVYSALWHLSICDQMLKDPPSVTQPHQGRNSIKRYCFCSKQSTPCLPGKQEIQGKHTVATLNSSKTEAGVRANNGIVSNLVTRSEECERKLSKRELSSWDRPLHQLCPGLIGFSNNLQCVFLQHENQRDY